MSADASLRERALADAHRVGDAVLFEGYLLYPYRASAAKNRVRWQWGVLMPPAYVAASPDERSGLRTEVVLDPRAGAEVTVTLRFLHVRARAVQRWNGSAYVPAPSLTSPRGVVVPFDEAEPAEVEARATLDVLLEAGVDLPVDLPGGHEVETVTGADGQVCGQVVRRAWPLRATLAMRATRLPGPYGAVRLTVTVDNASAFPARPRRDVALRRALVGTHLVLSTTAGAFCSMVDPPEWAAGTVSGCRNLGAWPVLVGAEQRSPVVLASPVILEDAPKVAPESQAEFFDATEIDELLSLRTLTLTDEEKAEARATDPRAAALLDQVEGLPPEVFDRLHGAIRGLDDRTGPVAPPRADPVPDPDADPPAGAPAEVVVASDGVPTVGGFVPEAGATPWWDPGEDTSVSPETDRVRVGGVSVGRGDVVRLEPGARRADAHDLFVAGREARVEAVLLDVDGGTHLAVTLVDDPAADLLAAEGRFSYFRPDEVVPVTVHEPDGEVAR
ncbi:MAG: hypothetical protein ACRDYU_11395 [Actinomycetes bacterium]